MSLLIADEHGTISVEKVEGNSLTEVLSKLPLMIHVITEKEIQKQNQLEIDDDIPF